MGWRVGTFGHVTEIAQVTLIGYLAVIGLINPVYFHRGRFVNQVKQCRERIAQAYAAATAMTDVKHTLELGIKIFLIVKRFRLPIQRMPGWCL
jgi:hypothetical protein